MKKFILLFFVLIQATFSQFQNLVVPFRVITVSPNYNNVYPRFSTLQNAYLSVKDSANAGKYFIINVVTAQENIVDWSSSWRDSILAKYPFLRFTSFGAFFNDSILGVNSHEFTLPAGILHLNPATAGNGLYFFNHQYHIRPKSPLRILNDSIWIKLNDSIFIVNDGTTRSEYVTLKTQPNSGIGWNSSGLTIKTKSPVQVFNDSIWIKLNDSVFHVADGTIRSEYVTIKRQNNSAIGWNINGLKVNVKNPIVITNDSITLAIDSGLVVGVNGLSVYVDGKRITRNPSKQLTISDNTGGEGLVWRGDSLNILLATKTLQNDNIDNILTFSGDSLQFNYYPYHFLSYPDGLALKLDSGLYAINGVQLNLDHNELNFNPVSRLQTAPSLWGRGLSKIADSANVLVNEFATIQNDTVKIKTSYVLEFYGATLSPGLFADPYDTTGVPVLANGKIKRVTYTYRKTSLNDTVIISSNNFDVNATDKIRLQWVHGSSVMNIQRWQMSTKAWLTAISLPFPNFSSSHFRVLVELYAEVE